MRRKPWGTLAAWRRASRCRCGSTPIRWRRCAGRGVDRPDRGRGHLRCADRLPGRPGDGGGQRGGPRSARGATGARPARTRRLVANTTAGARRLRHQRAVFGCILAHRRAGAAGSARADRTLRARRVGEPARRAGRGTRPAEVTPRSTPLTVAAQVRAGPSANRSLCRWWTGAWGTEAGCGPAGPVYSPAQERDWGGR